MPVIENKYLSLAINDKGLLKVLKNKQTGQQYAGGATLWRLYFQKGDQMDREIVGSHSVPQITKKENEIELYYPQVIYQESALNISVRINVCLENDESRWNIELTNNEDIILRECQFPLIHDLQLKDDQPLLNTCQGGRIIKDIRQKIKDNFTYYKASDHLFLHYDCGYPYPAANNCYVFPADNEGLYFACYDSTFEYTMHIFRLYGEKLECGFARYPSLKNGQSAKLGEYVISAYCGKWHVAADKYRNWAENWFSKRKPPEWVRRFKAWHRIILKHQYGEVHYDYKGISQIHDDSLKAGIDTLHLFGWWQAGMDNGNPDYVIDNEMGGKQVLKEEIAKFQKEGSVILYSNGQLIDLDTDYYKTIGKKISIKDKFGAEIRDAYRFRASGSFTGHFGNRTFTAACPYCNEWFEKMKEVINTAIELGCKGVFFDQLGANEFPCFDKSHGHPTPFMGISAAKAELVKKLRDYAASKDLQLAIGIEHLTDISAMNCDFIHSCPGYTTTSNDWQQAGEKPELICFIDWFRYAFPEIILTDREIRDDTDVERRVNHALLMGLRSDVEIYRCRKTITETPNYMAYLKKANALRDKYYEFLLKGRYVDTIGFSCSSTEVEARGFLAEDSKRMAIVVTQSHLEFIEAEVTVKGWRYENADGLGCFEVTGECDKASIHLEQFALAIVIFKK